MKDSICVSVIIPVYNGEKFIEKTVAAIQKGIYKNIEIILVDDGSKDRSEDIIRQLAKQDNRIKAIRKENGGIISARNAGLDMAHGDYICFCDQDDEQSEWFVLTMLTRILEENADAAFCAHRTFFGGEYYVQSTYVEQKTVLKGVEIQEKLLYPLIIKKSKYGDCALHGWYGTVWNGMYAARVIRENRIRFSRFLDYEDDYLFVINHLVHDQKVVLCPETMYTWINNENSESHKDKKKYIDDCETKVETMNHYIENILLKNGMYYPKTKEWKNYIGCESFIRILRNESSDVNPKTIWQTVRYLRGYCEKRYIRDGLNRCMSYTDAKKTRMVLLLFKFRLYLLGYLINKYCIYINI